MIVAARFHPAIGRALVQAARARLERGGVRPRRIRLIWVPGAFELPFAAARAARARPRPDAIIAVGALIRGETPQYQVIAHAVAQSLQDIAVTSDIPVSFGVIVASTLAQARARSGGRAGNRGAEAAEAALAVLGSLS